MTKSRPQEIFGKPWVIADVCQKQVKHAISVKAIEPGEAVLSKQPQKHIQNAFLPTTLLRKENANYQLGQAIKCLRQLEPNRADRLT